MGHGWLRFLRFDFAFFWDWFVHNNFHIISNNPVINLGFRSLQFTINTYWMFHSLNSLLGLCILFHVVANLPADYPAKKMHRLRFTGSSFQYSALR